MSEERPDFRELVGDDLTPEEELELARVDGLLRSVPGPATEVPGSLTRAVERIGTTTPIWTRRRLVAAVALAATLAAFFFGVGRWVDRGGFDARATVQMTAGKTAPDATAKLLRFAGQLEVAPEHATEVAGLMPRVLDVLNTYLRAVDVRDLEEPSSLARLRAQMLRRVQVVTGEGRVRDLLITEFVLN